jgi:hypothetical protein
MSARLQDGKITSKIDPQLIITCQCGKQKTLNPFQFPFRSPDDETSAMDWKLVEKALKKQGWMESFENEGGWFCSQACLEKYVPLETDEI